ncbi:transglycosylase SLT domain-containing protein [Micromonospora sp. WMMC241]|uniref:glycoside hydrolase family 19 protein n=1 Tax=Micromonospora sp. WMMC241 TaxID=3015159 RepID=UPI0022B63B4F|nr:glycoside hydrolase family 19 protein [Micromonospora sp. WMMC241]MCZ7436875.1 transglycosylase SLT domain-containing protein [Micromonospora sp. WMMC241]
MSKLAAARAAHQTATNRFGTTQLAWLVISMVGMLPLAAMAALALIVLVVVILLSGSQMTSYSPDPESTLGPGAGGSVLTELAGGDGRGGFQESGVPEKDLVAPIRAAARECDLLTPVILAAQIEYASDFDADKEGQEGRKGLSQLTPEVFERYGEDDDDSGEASALDPEDSIHAHARYFCHLAEETQRMLDEETVVGDHLTLTLMAWDQGLEAVKAQGGMPVILMDSYPLRVRGLFARYTIGGTDTSTATPSPELPPSVSVGSGKRVVPDGDGAPLTGSTFDTLFPGRDSFYTYAGLTDAMAKFPAFAATGDEATRRRELAAFLANVDHETGGLAHVDEIDRAAWGTYCDGGQPYGCPAGRTAYHGRGPIQLSWNSNYKAAGDALGLDLLGNPDLVATDPSVAWQTALWFWMTQRGAGTTTPHAAITGGEGFGGTIRSINGALECGGGNAGQVGKRVDAYRRITAALDVDPGDEGTLRC